MMILSAMLVAIPASAEEIKKTSDIVVDTNVFKGDYIEGDELDVDSVIVWSSVKEGKYDNTCEYGNFIYVACKDSNIDIAKGVFNPAEAGKERFATRFDTTRFKKGVEYAVKAYVKDSEGNYKFSRTTAFFTVNDAELKTITPYIHGANIVYDDQESASNYAQDQVNTQYFVYRKLSDSDASFELLGATNELGFNVVDDLFDSEGAYEATSYDIIVKSVSGLNIGGASATYTFEIQSIASAEDFMLMIGTDSDADHGAQNVYQVLDADIDLTNEVWRSWSIIHDNWKTGVNLHSLVKYYSDTLDGRGHKITLKYDVNDTSTVPSDGGQLAGLFGLFSNTAFIRNLHYEIDAKHGTSHTITGGERSCGFAMVGVGSYENCYMKATLAGATPDGSARARRDAFVGFPGNYVATNVIAELHLLDNDGNSLGEIPQHGSAESNYGTAFNWEGIHTPEANYFIMVDPIKMGNNAGIGMQKGKHCTYYNSFDDLLSGTKGVVLDQEGLGSMDKGSYRNGTAYESGWNSDIWEFNQADGYIKFFGNKIYQKVTE